MNFYRIGRFHYYGVREDNVLHLNTASSIINVLQRDYCNEQVSALWHSMDESEALLPIEEEEFFVALGVVLMSLNLPQRGNIG